MPTIDFDSLQDPSPEEMYKLTKWRIAQILAYGQVKSSDGQSLSHADLPSLQKTLSYWSGIVSAGSDTDGGTALVSFADP